MAPLSHLRRVPRCVFDAFGSLVMKRSPHAVFVRPDLMGTGPQALSTSLPPGLDPVDTCRHTCAHTRVLTRLFSPTERKNTIPPQFQRTCNASSHTRTPHPHAYLYHTRTLLFPFQNEEYEEIIAATDNLQRLFTPTLTPLSSRTHTCTTHAHSSFVVPPTE